jgi:transcriptional regulator with XRE-family HTH domain
MVPHHWAIPGRPRSPCVSARLRINTLGDHIPNRRLDLNLIQKQVAEQLGVDEMTITNWERNTNSPAIRHVPAILELLGYGPIPAAYSFPERLATARKRLGLSRRKLAGKVGVHPPRFGIGSPGGIAQPRRAFA